MSWLYLEQLRQYSEQMLRRHREEDEARHREDEACYRDEDEVRSINNLPRKPERGVRVK